LMMSGAAELIAKWQKDVDDADSQICLIHEDPHRPINLAKKRNETTHGRTIPAGESSANFSTRTR